MSLATVVGVVEGFYGTPWTADERIDVIRFEASAGMNTYLYAPKSDPWHRDRWREPYPAAALDELARVARAADEAGVRFVYAIAPALDMRFADDAEHAALAAKCEQVREAGVREFALLFDDVAEELASPADRTRYGDGGAGNGAAHGEAAARFADAFLARHGIDGPFLVCPTDYAGTGRSSYRDAFAAALPERAVVLWTGHDIVVGEVTAAHARSATAAFGRPLVLWDNFPVNDFDASRVFLGPLLGRDPELADVLAGILANPMPEAPASRFALHTVATWARDPRAYDPDAAWAAARRDVAGAGEAGIAPLLDAASSWPPSADRDPVLSAAVRGAIAGDEEAAGIVERRYRALAATEGGGLAPELRASLAPWIDAARRTGEAGLLGLAVLRGGGRGGEAGADPAALAAASERLETPEADVLRAITRELIAAATAAAPG